MGKPNIEIAIKGKLKGKALKNEKVLKFFKKNHFQILFNNFL